MLKEENAHALEVLAALLPLDTPERRQAEVDAFLAWYAVNKKRARELGGAWWNKETLHKDLIVQRICRMDPGLIRRLVSKPTWRNPCVKRVWLETLLENWQEGDSKTVEVLLRGYRQSHVDKTMPLLLERLPTFSEQDRRRLAPTLVQLLCDSWDFIQKPEHMGALLVGLGDALSAAPQCTYRVVNAMLRSEEKDLPLWSRNVRRYVREHCPSPVPEQAELVFLIRKISATVAFENRYRYRKPRLKVSRRFLARWRRLVAAKPWIESIPVSWACTHFLELREKHMNETPAWLLAGLPETTVQ